MRRDTLSITRISDFLGSLSSYRESFSTAEMRIIFYLFFNTFEKRWKGEITIVVAVVNNTNIFKSTKFDFFFF